MRQIAPINRSLDRQISFLGFETTDLCIIGGLFLGLDVLMSISGNSSFFTWIPTLLTAIVIRILKLGKPRFYLKHLVNFTFIPKYLSPWKSESKFNRPIMQIPKYRNRCFRKEYLKERKYYDLR